MMPALWLVDGVAWVRDEDRILLVEPGRGVALWLDGSEAYAWELWAEGQTVSAILERLQRCRRLSAGKASATWSALRARLVRDGLATRGEGVGSGEPA